jgi:hypothetical protein
MPAAIASLTFDALQGPPFPAPAPQVETWTRPGVAGAGATISAAHPRRWEGVTVYADTAANCGTQKIAAEALIGTKISATDAWGTTRTGCLVEDAIADITPATGATGIEAVLSVRWTLLIDDLAA